MLQDNFSIIRSFLRFPENSDVFYHVELIGRKKDNPDLKESQKSFGDYFITSFKMFDAVKDEIIAKCRAKKCRAYINLNPKSRKAVGLQMMHKLITMVENNDFTNLFALTASASGTVNGIKDHRLFIIDIDDTDNNSFDAVSEVWDIIKTCRRTDMTTDPYVGHVKTATGFHVIATPFDISDFNKKKTALTHCTAEVKTNSPTLLFVDI